MARARPSSESPRGEDPDGSHGRRLTPKGEATRARLVRLAGEIFAREGYNSVSVRDIAGRSGLSSGAIYGSLSGKGELLTEAIEARIRDDVEALPAGLREQTLPAIDAYQFAHTRERAELRALLLEGATAARTDEDVRERLHETLMARIDLATDAHEEWGDRAGVDGSLDMRSLVLLLWSADVGLGLLDALGIEGPDEKTWSTLVLRLLKSLEEPNADPGAPSPRALPGD